MVAFDATALMLFLEPAARPPLHPDSKEPITSAHARMRHLAATLEKERARIIIPTPALSEILVRAGTAGPQYLEILGKSAVFRIASFDQRAAIELAALAAADIANGDKRGGAEGIHSKIKYDRQIVAIAKVEGARIVYSDDKNVRNFGTRSGLAVVGCHELPLPEGDRQMSLFRKQDGTEEER